MVVKIKAHKIVISVILCAHNPRAEYIVRTLQSLREQELPTNAWELIVVDNASGCPLSDQYDLSWHPNGSHVLESTLGLTHARVRGIRESTGQLIVFVDDDNMLAPDYFDKLLEIRSEHPRIAAIGGAIVPEYEVKPPDWFSQFSGCLAIREITTDYWSNYANDYPSTPLGAGLAVTREVAEFYCQTAKSNPIRAGLDRSGVSLFGAGDLDLALCACDLGYGKGVFAALIVTHLIPKERLELEYLVRLRHASGFSTVLLRSLREPSFRPPKSWTDPLRYLLHRLRLSKHVPEVRQMILAREKGIKDGYRQLGSQTS